MRDIYQQDNQEKNSFVQTLRQQEIKARPNRVTGALQKWPIQVWALEKKCSSGGL